MTSIMCSVMEETESYTLELFDVIVGAMTQQGKKESSVGCDMMKTVIASCPNNLQPFVERQVNLSSIIKVQPDHILTDF